jgi:hypothetical protein
MIRWREGSRDRWYYGGEHGGWHGGMGWCRASFVVNSCMVVISMMSGEGLAR